VDQSLLKSLYGEPKPSREQTRRHQPQLEPIHLVYASDDRSLVGVEASIRSVMKHASEPVVFHYIGNAPLKNLPEVRFYNLKKVAKKYKLKEFTNPRERGEDSYQGINSNLANYARFAMDSLLKKQPKAMWVDVDTVIKCDVVPMVRNALSDKTSANIIAAVPGERAPRGFAKGVREQYNLTVSFNAGVYVVDLDKWRSEKMTTKICEIALKNRKEAMYSLGSQAPMALAIGNKFEQLPWIWNAKVSNFDRNDRQANAEEACLLHWSGRYKPWEQDGPHKDLWKPYASI